MFRRLMEASDAREIADDMPPAEMACAEYISICVAYTKRDGAQMLFREGRGVEELRRRVGVDDFWL
jgi:hypothetical protein